MNAAPKLELVQVSQVDDEIKVIGLDEPLLPDGIYEAVFEGHETSKVFNSDKVFLRFRIVEFGDHFGERLYRAYRVKSLKSKPGRKGSYTLNKRSELLLMLVRVLGLNPRKDRPSLLGLKNRVLKIRTRTVKTDSKQRPLPECLWYSVVDDVVSIVDR